MWNRWSDDGGAKTGKREQTIKKGINMIYETGRTVLNTYKKL